MRQGGSRLAILEVTVVPVGTDEASFSSYVVESLKVAQDEGVKFQVTPTGTVLEGDLPKLLDVAGKMHQAAFRKGTARVFTTIQIDDRVDKPLSIERAVQTVSNQMH